MPSVDVFKQYPTIRPTSRCEAPVPSFLGPMLGRTAEEIYDRSSPCRPGLFENLTLLLVLARSQMQHCDCQPDSSFYDMHRSGLLNYSNVEHQRARPAGGENVGENTGENVGARR